MPLWSCPHCEWRNDISVDIFGVPGVLHFLGLQFQPHTNYKWWKQVTSVRRNWQHKTNDNTRSAWTVIRTDNYKDEKDSDGQMAHVVSTKQNKSLGLCYNHTLTYLGSRNNHSFHITLFHNSECYFKKSHLSLFIQYTKHTISMYCHLVFSRGTLLGCSTLNPTTLWPHKYYLPF